MGQQLYVSDNHIKVNSWPVFQSYLCICVFVFVYLYLCICRWSASHTAWAPRTPSTDCLAASRLTSPRYNKISAQALSSWHEPQMWTHVVSSNSDWRSELKLWEQPEWTQGVHLQLVFIQTECVLEVRQSAMWYCHQKCVWYCHQKGAPNKFIDLMFSFKVHQGKVKK